MKSSEAFNPLLAEFPTEYKGLKLNTDFRVGILCNKVITNPSLNDFEKQGELLNLLFDEEPEDFEIAWEAVTWFLNLGYNKSVNSLSNENDNLSTYKVNEDDAEDLKDYFQDQQTSQDDLFDFDFDSSRIYSGFLRTYGIDLSKESIHFFKFMFLLSDLDENCAYNRVVDIRTASLQGKKGKDRAAYIRMKKLYAIPVEFTDEDREYLNKLGFDEDDLKDYFQY